MLLLLLGCPSPPRPPGGAEPEDTVADDTASDTDADDTGPTGPDDTADTDTGDTDTDTPILSCSAEVESIGDLGAFGLPGDWAAVYGGWSQEVGGASYWVFREAHSDVAGDDGSTLRGGVAALLTNEEAPGTFVTGEDGAGVAVELLADDPTDDCEPAHPWGAVRAGPYTALAWVAHGDEALLFYGKSCASDGTRGHGIARWAPRVGSRPARLQAGSGADPEVLFPIDPETVLGAPPNFLPGRAALVVEVGATPYVYAYACNGTFWSIQSCGVGRAAWEEAGDPAAWAVWSGTAWVSDPAEMAFLFQTTLAGGFTVTWNEAIGAYVAWLPGGEAGVYVATAPAPEGPWSEPVLVDTVPDAHVLDTIAHPELGRPGTDRITVASDAGVALWDAHFVCEG